MFEFRGVGRGFPVGGTGYALREVFDVGEGAGRMELVSEPDSQLRLAMDLLLKEADDPTRPIERVVLQPVLVPRASTDPTLSFSGVQ